MLSDRIWHGGLLLVSDQTLSPAGLSAARSLNAQPVRIDDFGDHLLANDPSIIFDVDLRLVENVRKLRGALARRGRGCRVFLIDPAARVTIVHANVLGADALLTKHATAEELNATIQKHFGISPASMADKALMQSIDGGVQALDSAFSSLSGNMELDTGSVIDASGKIADAVAGLGVEDWLATVKGYHFGTFQHCMLVTGVAAAFGTKTGMARRDVVRLAVAGLLHDIGKAAVPLAILDKPGALTEAEMAVLRQHPVVGYDYLKTRSGVSADTLSSVRHHHEFLDGTGYPDRLSGRQIDDITRIITICDIYAALIERRSYKPTKGPTEAMAILKSMAEAGKVEASLVREMDRFMVPKAA